jgi:neurofibromin 1
MERASNKSLDLVMDMTLYSSSNEIPSQYISQILQLLPFDASDNIASILVYNPNSYLRKYVKKLSRPLSHKMTKRTFFAVTLAELYEYINPSEVRLPKSTSKS